MTAPSPGTVLPHLRLSWGGSLGDAGEIWSNSLAFELNSGETPTEAELLAIATTTAPTLADLVAFAPLLVSVAVRAEWVKATWILNTGRQRDVNTALYEWPANSRPQGQSQAVPWTQTYAVTLRTPVQRGRGHSGRIFPPPCGPMPENRTPYAPTAFATSMAQTYGGAILGLRDAINTALVGDTRFVNPVVVSRRTPDGRPAMLTQINGTVVDRVADVMHKRTNRVERSEGAPYTWNA